MMVIVLVYTVLVALLAAFMVLLAYKWGVVEYLQVHGNEFISKMAHCEFCLSWWCCVFLSVVIIHHTGNFYLLLVPFMATPITRRLL